MGDQILAINSGAVKLRGPFGNNNGYKSMSAITDGTSNTLMFSERTAHNDNNLNNGVLHTADGSQFESRYEAQDLNIQVSTASCLATANGNRYRAGTMLKARFSVLWT